MWIQQIILDGFKSYATRTVITDFDPYFNAITGLNGSGKSNILDAICFVLGITNLSQNLQELVYKQGQAGVTKASVTIVFDNTDKAQSPVGYEQYDQIAVTRQVVVGGRNKYLINGHNAQVNRVQNLFHSVQLNVNNPHFLIMQGRITKVLNMKPPEILAMIEEAAGTRMYELKKENALKTIEKKEKKVEEITRILTEEITPTLEKLRGERVHYIQWTTNSQELEKLQRFMQAYEYYRAKDSLDKLSEVNELVKSVEASKQAAAEMAERLREIKEEIATLTKQKEKKMGEEFKALDKHVDQLAKEVVKLTQTLSHTQEAVETERTQKATLSKNVTDTRQAIAAKSAEYDKQKTVCEAAEAEVRKLQGQLAELQAGLQSGAAVGLAADGDGVKTLTDKLMETKREAATATTELKAAQLKIKHISAELTELRKAAKASGKEQSDLQRQFETESAALAELDGQLKNAKGEEKEAALLSRKKEVEAALQELREKVDALRSKLTELEFEYSDPEKGFDRSRVKGLVASLIKVQDAANTTAIEVAAGGKLYNVVVDTDATSKLLLDKGRLKRRVTIIPLNKIAAKSLAPATVAKAQEVAGGKKNCSVALSLVGFDDEIEAAMKFVFGNTLVCRDSDVAKRVTFNPDVRARTVTLDGDVYDPSGTLTGGSRPTTSVLRRLQELNDAQAALEEKEAELATLNSQLATAQAEGARVKALRQQRETKSHALSLLEAGMKQSAAGRVVTQIKELEAKLEEANAQAEELKRREEAATKACAETEQKMAEFEKRGNAGIKDAEAQIAAMKTKATAATKKLKPQQQEGEKLRLELEALRAELAALEEQSAASEQTLEKLSAEARKTEEALAAKKTEYETANTSLSAKRTKLAATDRSIADLISRRDDITRQIEENELEAKKREHKIARFNKEQDSARSAVHRMETQHPWITAEKGSFGKAGTAFDFKAQDPQKVQEKLHRIQEEQNKLTKHINRKVMSMFEKAEGEYQNLVAKKTIIENDKAKLIAVIDELDQKKNEALTSTYQKVNKDFGSIFATLLPGTKAKLETAGASITDGLEVRVAFGGTWKESLTELSGGQKSLLALSLILALLLFKPAPMYILDEIDAALDLSHTQNIGQMLRTHFAKSQFIIVSLKEGMFNNANVLFKTKFVEGVSTVTRTEPGAEHAHATTKGKERSGKVN